MKRKIVSASLIATVVLAMALPLSAEDEFRVTVDRIAQRVGSRPIRIPFLGLFLLFTPARGSHLKLATWDNVPGRLSLEELQSSMAGALSADWHPFVKVDSRRSHESTLIYARACGNDMRLMIVTAESGEVTVVQVDVPKNLQGSWLEHTGKMAHHASKGDVEGDGDGA